MLLRSTGSVSYTHLLHFLPKSSIQRHRSPWGELNFALSGIMEIGIEDTTYLSPPHYAIWIPPQIPHCCQNQAEVHYACIDVPAAACATLPATPCTCLLYTSGPLRGKAMAGARGDTSARIFTTHLDAELLAVAGVYRVVEDKLDRSLHNQPALVRLDGDTLRIEALKA